MPLYRRNGKIVFFIHIPKCGGTSVERAFRQSGCAEALRLTGKKTFTRVTFQHMHKRFYDQAIDRGFYDYQFAIVRNPYARLASEYRMKVSDAPGRPGKQPKDNPDDWIAGAFKRYGKFRCTRDNHIRPQHHFTGPEAEIFRFEDGLANATRQAFMILDADMPEQFPHSKRSSSVRPKISEKTAALIEKFYREDFTRFDYDASDPTAGFDVV